MVRSQEEAVARLQDEHIACELGISIDTLDLHVFDLIDAGLGHPTPRWRVLWQGSPPEGVTFYGSGNFTWSEIAAMPAEGEDRKAIDG